MPITNSLKAGAGKAAIGYPENFFPYRGFRGRRLLGVHDDIHARVLLLEKESERFLLISLELGDITNEWAPEISKETGVPADHIWFTVTHNHAAPYANSTWGEFVPDEEKTESFCRCCIDAILRAYADAKAGLRPARMLYSEGNAYVNVNRDVKYTGHQPNFTAPYITAKNIHGYSDRTVSVLQFVDEDDRAFAYVVGYAVHSSALFRQFWGDEGGMLVSGDLSGAAMRYVEKRSDAIAIHVLGCAADQNARFNVVGFEFDREGNAVEVIREEGGYDMVNAMAAEWGSEVLLAAQSGIVLPVDAIAVAKTVVTAATKEKYEGGHPMTLPADYEWKIKGTADMPLFMVRIGSLALFGIPGEMVARVGTDIKNALREAGFDQALVVTQCNGAVSYMSDEDGYAKKTFEATQSHFAPGIAGIIEAGAVGLAREIR